MSNYIRIWKPRQSIVVIKGGYLIRSPFIGLCYKAGRAAETTKDLPTSVTPETWGEMPEIKRPEKTDKARYAFPYTMDEKFVTQTMSYKDGYREDVPPYVAIYDAPSFDIFLYIFPPKECDAVWLCFPKQVNISAKNVEEFHGFNAHHACDESLRFHPLEQMVYIKGYGQREEGATPTTKSGSYPYWSNLVEILYQPTSAGKKEYLFTPFSGDFDGEDVSKAQRGEQWRFYMDGNLIFLFTSSPYCGTRIMRPFQGALLGRKVLFWGETDEKKLFRERPGGNRVSMYYLTGTQKGSAERQSLWKEAPASAFYPPTKKTKEVEANCCPLTWEFEGFVLPGEWTRDPSISFLKYTLGVRSEPGCKDPTKADQVNHKFHSLLLEVGDVCEWVRICFDQSGSKGPCSDDTNTLSFVFVHNMLIPTDSDEARQLGLDFEKQDPIRINFLKGSKGIEVAYAFSDHLVPGIRELMQLDIYDGEDPGKLELTLVRAPQCEARLLNDLGTANLRYGTEYDLQCLYITKCECRILQ